MYTNRTELMLYTRYGRLPPGSRAGPSPVSPPLPRHEYRGDRPRLGARGVAALARARSRNRRAIARERYLELEFAVGFPPEDELRSR